MSRPTRAVLITSIVLVALAAACVVARYIALNGDFSGMLAGARWRIAIRMFARAEHRDAYTKLLITPRCDSQQITDQRFIDSGMSLRILREGYERNRIAQWTAVGGPGPKEMSFSFLARPQPGQEPSPPIPASRRNREIQYYLRDTDRIQSSAPLIQQTAQELTDGLTTPDDKVEAVYSFCAYRIANSYVPGTHDAMTCLTNGMSDCGGKSRLMVALCRAVGVPARLVGGLILSEGVKRDTHVWVEVWLDNAWVSYCPLNRYRRTKPPQYLVLYRGDYPLIRHRFMKEFSYDFELRRISLSEITPGASSNSWRALAARASLTQLSPNSQWVLRFLLLIPLGALVVCIIRNILGIPTLGTFAPVLIALGIHLSPLRWGIFTLVLFLGLGLTVRWLIDRMQLLLVPRLSVMLTLVIVAMVAFVILTDQVALQMGVYVSLLPVVILTMAIERCWMLELEDGVVNMLLTVLGTLFATTVICFVFRWRTLVDMIFLMPELLLVVIAAMLLLGRYAGFRLNEVVRFRAIAEDANT